MQKPNLTTVSVVLCFCELFSFDLWPTKCINSARFHVQISNKLKTESNWSIVLCLESFQPINALVYAVFTAFLFLSEFKPTNVLDGAAFLRYFFFRICSISTTSTYPNFMRKQATIWKITNIGTIFIAWKDINHQCLGWCCNYCKSLFLAKTKPTNVVNKADFLWDAFSFQFISYQPLQCCQISCANKDKVGKTKTLVQCQKVLKPFRDRKSQFIVLLSGFSTITCELPKVCRQVKHSKKGLWDLSDWSNRKVCLHLKFLRKSTFCFVSCLFGKVLDDFQKNIHTNVLAFLQTISGLECFQGLYQVTCHCFRVGETHCCIKKGNSKKAIF